MSIEESVFGDDLVAFVKNRSQLKYNLMLWKETLEKRNMNINEETKKIVILGEVESIEIEVEDIKLEHVKSFKYLEVQIKIKLMKTY